MLKAQPTARTRHAAVVASLLAAQALQRPRRWLLPPSCTRPRLQAARSHLADASASIASIPRRLHSPPPQGGQCPTPPQDARRQHVRGGCRRTALRQQTTCRCLASPIAPPHARVPPSGRSSASMPPPSQTGERVLSTDDGTSQFEVSHRSRPPAALLVLSVEFDVRLQPFN